MMYEWRPWVEEPFVLLTPSSLEVNDPHQILATQPFIRYDCTLWGGKVVDDYLRQVDIQPIERYELESLRAIACLVNEELGVSLVPD